MPETEIRPGPGDRAPDRLRLPDQESRQLSRRGAGEGPPDRPHPPETDPQKTDGGTHHVDDTPDTPPREEPHPHRVDEPNTVVDDTSAKPSEKPSHELTWDDVADGLPTDRSGYQLRPRDCEYLGITPQQVYWWRTHQAPLGMTPQQYNVFRTTLREALEADGVDPIDVDVRLQGSAARFFSGAHKHLPMPGGKGWSPHVAERIAEWFGDDPARPASRPFDSGRKLGIDRNRSDYDVQISSDTMVEKARHEWLQRKSMKPFTRDRYGFVDRNLFQEVFPELKRWRRRWERTLHRKVPPALFGSSGPPTFSRTGMSAAFRTDDWLIDLSGR